VPTSITPRGEDKRRRILDAALQVIAAEGVRAVTHRRVAAEAGASLGLITYYFASTDSMISATLEMLTERETSRLRGLVDVVLSGSLDVDDLVELLVDEVSRHAGEHKDEAMASIALTLEIPRERVSREAFDKWELAQYEFYEAIAKAIESDDPTDVATYLMASMEGLGLYAAIAPDPAHIREAARVGLGRFLHAAAAELPAGAP
jgi:TetR/AcrR family transcriptional regulator, regulator of biofilm formation and stress response